LPPLPFLCSIPSWSAIVIPAAGLRVRYTMAHSERPRSVSDVRRSELMAAAQAGDRGEPLQRRARPQRAVDPAADDLASENHGVLSKREVLELDGIGRRPRLVQAVTKTRSSPVLQRQVNGVPTADEYFETACHRASVDRTGGAFEGPQELTCGSLGAGTRSPVAGTSHAARTRSRRGRRFRGDNHCGDGSCHVRATPGRRLVGVACRYRACDGEAGGRWCRTCR